MFKNVLNLAGALQNINSTKVLSIRNESRDEYLDSVSNSIDYIQMRIFYLRLTSITERSNDQVEKAQFAFIVKIISCKLYIL